MPSKGQRAASRQAKLSKRKRKSKPGGSQIFHAEPITSSSPKSDDSGDQSSDSKKLVSKTDGITLNTKKSSTSISSKLGGMDAVPHYEYLSTELLRISMVSGLVILVLVVLTFLLGD